MLLFLVWEFICSAFRLQFMSHESCTVLASWLWLTSNNIETSNTKILDICKYKETIILQCLVASIKCLQQHHLNWKHLNFTMLSIDTKLLSDDLCNCKQELGLQNIMLFVLIDHLRPDSGCCGYQPVNSVNSVNFAQKCQPNKYLSFFARQW